MSDRFMDYIGFRYTVVEEIIEECVSAINAGETEISIPCDDLSEEELRYVKKKIQERISD